MTHTLAGKRVVVTGAAGGIAQATIKELRAQGASVAGIDLRPVDDLIAADIRDPASVHAATRAPPPAPPAITEAVGRLGGLDILVNCAGIGTVQDAGQMPDEE